MKMHPPPIGPLGMVLVLFAVLLLITGCGSETDAVDAEVRAQANQPAVTAEPDTSEDEEPGLSADELAVEPENTIEPLEGEAAADQAYRELTWDDLLPEDFDFQTLRDKIDLDSYNIQSLTDEDAEAQRLYEDLQSVMSEVPMVRSLDGLDVRVPGFLVPLEMEADAVKEFFLVPYFGACIHTPPPPANQIVHVVLDEAIPFDNLYEPYWARGTLSVTQTETDIGTSGYRMVSANIRPYE